MKIALSIKNFSRRSGGGERYAVELAIGLATMGHAVTVFSIDADEDLKIGHNISVIEVDIDAFPSSLKQWRFSRKFKELVAEHNFDVVYALTECDRSDAIRLGGGFARVWLREKRDSFVGRLFESLRLRNILKIKLEDKIMSPGSNRIVVFNSRLCLKQAQDTYAFFPERGRVVYNGISPDFLERATSVAGQEFRKRFSISPAASVGLFMANNFGRKGLDVLLNAFADVAKQDETSVLVVAGRDRRGRAVFEKQAKKLGLSERVIFTGRVDSAGCFAASDVFVLPTKYDPFSNVCLEAMACGLPVLTTPMNGAAEIIEHGQNGFVCSSVNEFKAAMVKLLDKDIRTEFSKAARVKAQDFSIENNISQTASLLKEIAQAKRAGSVVGVDSVDSMQLRRRDFNINAKTTDELKKLHQGQIIKHNRKRKVIRAEVDGRVFYIKEQYPVTLREMLKMALKFEAPFCQARREWDNLRLMAELGIPSARASVCAWSKGFNKESFLWMDDIGENLRLEDFFAVGSNRTAELKRNVIKRTAAIARTLHGSGYVHKDFYLGHFFVLKSEIDEDALDPQVLLLDVQRVKYVGRWNRRWMIKDLSALNFSSFATEFSAREKLRFFSVYIGGDFSPKQKRAIIRAVLKKSVRIEAHTKKLLARRRAAEFK